MQVLVLRVPYLAQMIYLLDSKTNDYLWVFSFILDYHYFLQRFRGEDPSIDFMMKEL
jgi:hypothetical protein